MCLILYINFKTYALDSNVHEANLFFATSSNICVNSDTEAVEAQAYYHKNLQVLKSYFLVTKKRPSSK